jgi:uncharacterized protein
MRVLITGATGFVGSALSRHLTNIGHDVVALTRDPDGGRRKQPFIREFHHWHPDAEPSSDLLKSVDAVVNLAGESVAGRWTAGKKRRIYESRIVGTRNLVAAMRKADAPKVLVNASAVGYYGDRGEEELNEAAGIGKGFLAEVTRDWEAEALNAAADGVRVAVMRLGIVMGREGGALKTMLPLLRLAMGGPLGSGKQWWPWVHIEDVTLAITAAIEEPLEGVFNLTSPRPVRQRDFARALGKAVGRPAFLPVPGFVLRAVQGEFADEVLFSKRVLPDNLAARGFRFTYEDVGSALQDLLGSGGAREDVLAGA